ncbi:LacI family DNA-binding transcriptional regulator [Bifidobacterium sp. ESL0764]|uniref:LacI family DNA-binding transcriptional regulator n=1 Tax=Bifidobacterium sp. ESL0764 TaxID=2983228 RepID=UPI0023F7EE7F|nr:LacI family DNA-binding transcriptional regulator [Bifidobacterium sp. ESL0764]WEV65925.1 LacI family DNA-binding transcriptional regulator [Bifidobacterium sp. ESL0764]
MAGIKDVAKAAGVSASTVSYVLSGKRSISTKTSDKVLRAIDELGYIPDASAQKMRGKINHVIAIAPGRREVKHSSLSAYFMQTALQAKAAGYDVLLLTGEDAVEDIKRVTHSNLADGIVLLDVEQDDARAAMAAEYGKPCVAIGYPDQHDDCACVDINFEAMGRLAAQKLHDLGHKRVALLRSVENLNEPVSGYFLLFRDSLIAAADKFGMTIMESALTEDGSFDPNQFVSDCLFGDAGATAVVSQADPAVLNLMLGVLRVAKFAIPDNVSVLSCGTLLASQPMKESISEMPMTPKELCRQAIGILVESIERHRDIRGIVKLFRPKFIDRGSLGPAPISTRGGDAT